MIRQPNEFEPDRPRRVLVAVVTTLSAVGLGYFGVLGLVDPGALVPGGDAEAARTLASYMAVRSLVMGGAALLLLVLRAWRGLSLVLVVNAVVQTLDTVLGVVRQEVAATVAPAVIAVALFVAAAAILRSRTAPFTPVAQSR